MKKSLLVRIVAFLFLCFSSLLIKSETTLCTLKCDSIAKCPMAEQPVKSTAAFNPVYHDDGFFIKI